MSSNRPPDQYYVATVTPSGYVTYFDPDQGKEVTLPLVNAQAPATSPSPHYGVLTAAAAAPLINKWVG